MGDNIVKYSSRTFGEYREDLVNYIRSSYPEVISDFSDATIGSMLLELNAGVANNLSMNTDRLFQETQLQQAQKRSSLFDHAKKLGFNIQGRKPSVTVVDFTVELPVRGDGFDKDYAPVLMPGAVVSGGGATFETQDIIDWESPINSMGDPNRSVIPNLDSNGNIVSYSVTKREIVINGVTKIHKKVITSQDIRPFLQVRLPGNNVLSIESVILLEGTSHTSDPSISKFYGHDNRYYEVEYLTQQRIFKEQKQLPHNQSPEESSLKAGKWVDVTRKFIKEYTPNNICVLTFGAGNPDVDFFKDGFLKKEITNRFFLETFLSNTAAALGEKLKPNHTLFVRYRVGGGSGSNVGANTITDVGAVNMQVIGPKQDINQSVRRSLKVKNQLPAVGGCDGLSEEEIRHLIKYNMASQNRAIQTNDYVLQVKKMPGKFGAPFRLNSYKENNKIVIPILGVDSKGKLSNKSNNILQENIAEYLSQYRSVNDYVEVKNGRIFNLAFDIEVFVDDFANDRIANDVINIVKRYFNINNNQMGDDVYIGKLEEKILEVDGVLNLISIKAYNKIGGKYSSNLIPQEIYNEETGEIRLINNTVYSAEDSMFEIKYPEKDIKVYLRRANR